MQTYALWRTLWKHGWRNRTSHNVVEAAELAVLVFSNSERLTQEK